MINVISQNLGWTCPQCGSVYSPTTTECWRCNKTEQSYTITCITDTLNEEEKHGRK